MSREKLPVEREALTHKFKVGSFEGYITAGKYEDGRLGEMFLTDVGKEGSFTQGLMSTWALTFSVALQHGVPLKALIGKYAHIRFEPGHTGDPEYPEAASVVDYLANWLARKFEPELVEALWPNGAP